MTRIGQSDMPKEKELGSEQCEEAAPYWQVCVMINLVSLQDWLWQSSCRLVLDVIEAELWWQQENLPQGGWAMFLAVKP